MKRVLSGGMVAALLLMPAAVSAHHVPDIDQSASCSTGLTVRVDYSDYSQPGHVLRVETTYDGHTHTADRTPTGTGTLTLRYGNFSGAGLVHVEAWAVGEQPVHQTDDYAYGLHCAVAVAARARLSGPYLDPMYSARFWAGSKGCTFVWTRIDGGRTKSVVRDVAAGRSQSTGLKHADGGTRQTITACGKVVLRQTTAPGGNYPAP